MSDNETGAEQTNKLVLQTYETGDTLIFDYVNHRGQHERRTARIIGWSWRATPYHPEPGFILSAWDVGRNAVRDFAMKDMSNVRHEPVRRAIPIFLEAFTRVLSSMS